ncbi:MAG: GDSL-type esterase/lipase family protein [Nitrospira sp.]|nr:GDSL-type esterase/lipase family protein [Nitrospira sp.]
MVRHIICFGDSLTAGFQSPTPSHPTGRDTPYGDFLQEWLGASSLVRVSGHCGELTSEMAMRFRQDVLSHRPDYVVILGGTNDLGWNAQPSDIMENLLKMYELSRAERVIPVPVTVPSIRIADEGGAPAAAWIEDHLQRRRQLNELIRAYAESKKLAAVDLFAATAEPETGRLAAPYSNDGLHLTTAGYRRFAELLFDQIFEPVCPGAPGRGA